VSDQEIAWRNQLAHVIDEVLGFTAPEMIAWKLKLKIGDLIEELLAAGDLSDEEGE